MSQPRYPSLYQINTRVWLTELSRSLGRRATLDDVPEFARQGFDWIWFLSVWQTGPVAQQVSRSNAGWRKELVILIGSWSRINLEIRQNLAQGPL